MAHWKRVKVQGLTLTSRGRLVVCFCPQVGGGDCKRLTLGASETDGSIVHKFQRDHFSAIQLALAECQAW